MDSVDASLLIQAGSALYIIAFLIREELILRLTVIAGTVLYILYYYMFPDPPLWDAIIASVIMILANLIVLGQILLERTTFRLSAQEKRLFDAFETLTPGQFRHLLKHTQWQEASGEHGTVLTRQDRSSSSLFYVIEGMIAIEKNGRRFRLPAANFVGEIAYVLQSNPTATTVAPAGVRYVEWDSKAIRKLSVKRPNLGNALNALLTCDLAHKLADSYRPADAIDADEQAMILLSAV